MILPLIEGCALISRYMQQKTSSICQVIIIVLRCSCTCIYLSVCWLIWTIVANLQLGAEVEFSLHAYKSEVNCCGVFTYIRRCIYIYISMLYKYLQYASITEVLFKNCHEWLACKSVVMGLAYVRTYACMNSSGIWMGKSIFRIYSARNTQVFH